MTNPLIPLVPRRGYVPTPLVAELCCGITNSTQPRGAVLVRETREIDGEVGYSAFRVYRSPDQTRWLPVQLPTQLTPLATREEASAAFAELVADLDLVAAPDHADGSDPIIDVASGWVMLTSLRAGLLDEPDRGLQWGVVLGRAVRRDVRGDEAGFVVLDIHRDAAAAPGSLWQVRGGLSGSLEHRLIADYRFAQQQYRQLRSRLSAEIEGLQTAGKVAEPDGAAPGGMFVDRVGRHVPSPASATAPLYFHPGARSPAAAKALHLAWRQWRTVADRGHSGSSERAREVYEAVRDAVVGVHVTNQEENS